MPIISTSRDTFTWRVNQNGVPIAETITLGGIPYTPRCPLRELVNDPRKPDSPWHAQYALWLKRWPEASDCDWIDARVDELENDNEE